MERKPVGTVKALWRYPVKSMLGEERSELRITTRGVIGDRAWALRDLENKRIATAKKFPALLTLRAEYEAEPGGGDLPVVRITLPGGKTVYAADPGASEAISEAVGHPFQLEAAPHPTGERAGIDPHTVFGDVPFEQVFLGVTADYAPDFFNLPRDTFFDAAAIHLIASGTLAHMRRLSGDDHDFDYRRFRPNILVDTGGEADGFVEDGWLKGVLEVGEGVRIAGMEPALRCVMTTHRQQDLGRDLAILRATVKEHRANLGIFASVEEGGRVRVGAPLYLTI